MEQQTYLIYDERQELGDNGAITRPSGFERDGEHFTLTFMLHATEEEFNNIDLYKGVDVTTVDDGHTGSYPFYNRTGNFTATKNGDNVYELDYELELKPVDDVKLIKKMQILDSRNMYIRASYEYTASDTNTYKLPLDDFSVSKMLQALEVQRLTSKDDTDTILWKIDGTFHTLTYTLLKEFAVDISDRVTAAFQKEMDLYTELDAAVTSADAYVVTWTLT